MAVKLSLLAVVLWLAPWPALAWGVEGHEIIAHIAARQLTPRVRAAIGSLLGGDAEAMLVTTANWADEVRDARPETARWHFVNIELGTDGYVASRDCPGGDCVVARIGQFRAIAADRHQPPARRAEAVKFLVHLVGDIHQPLHAADNHDRGGNDIKLRLAGRPVSLHYVFDTALVERLGPDAGAAARQIITHPPPPAWRGGTPEDWADDSFQIAKHVVYPPLGGRPRQMPRAYWERQDAVVRLQLAKAGYRLGWLLNTIFR